ncbi:MAG TPA: hypothetical protein PK322_02385 [Opitutaceae bacterium]|nr:hypothetical protein [Opitutaceae bacterium]
MNALPPSLAAIGLDPASQDPANEPKLVRYIQLKLAALGFSVPSASGDDPAFQEIAQALLANHLEKNRLLSSYLAPADRRIQDWLERYLENALPAGVAVRLPSQSFVLDRWGLARLLSLPPDRNTYTSPILSSHRLANGILHNPKSDRRTTAGVFHIAEGGLPIPADKLAVPRETFARLFALALQPPAEHTLLPFTATQKTPAHCFVSLLLRPVVVPAIPGVSPEKSMEIRFFVPGSLVANLDFVESIFGNAGDPALPRNDAGLDPDHWTGHTGCVILAPHLVGARKIDLGLPAWDQATERQRRDGMAWKTPEELYNDGQAFKLCARDENGVIVTLIADNYFGYCKKEVKTQISYSANLFGLAEEEHSGGTLAFPSYDLGEDYTWDTHFPHPPRTLEDMAVVLGHGARYCPEGHAFDKTYPHIVYVPGNSRFDLATQRVLWTRDGKEQSLRLAPGEIYVYPWGYTVRMHKPAGGRSWRLIGTIADGRLCHKPCTVSGGGKSEISKSITDAILFGPVFVADIQKDFDQVDAILKKDYSTRFKPEFAKATPSRSILGAARSLGSVIKLLTPNPTEFTDEYNDWLRALPQHIKDLVFTVKRFHKAEWGDNWRSHFSVDIINGVPGNELKLGRRKLLSTCLRVGYADDGSWRVFSLRKDFHPAAKLQTEDDITASIVVPTTTLSGLRQDQPAGSVKLVRNCEYRLFQRPDDAVHRGYDKQTELDMSGPGNFFSNYEPLSRAQAWELIKDTIGFEQFTPPLQRLIREVAEQGRADAFVSPHQPRLVDGKPSKNPRYLQVRPDLLTPAEVHLRTTTMRLARRIPDGQPLHIPVSILLPGRRANGPEKNVPPLCCFSPIHYLELPEFFADAITSMTGKSPSTTGAGSEGALTKGPFNALCPITDLNNAFVAMALTGAHPFVTTAGTVGPHRRVDHDISLLVPEVFSRMGAEEQNPAWLIEHRYLERCADFAHEGRTLPASLLGWRVTERFVSTFFGRVFTSPQLVLTPEMLRPELQDAAVYAQSLETILATMRRVAALYFEDGSIEAACPPLRALLHIMRDGQYEGRTLADPAIRQLFTREAVLASDWYHDRLTRKQLADEAAWKKHIAYLKQFLARASHHDEAERLGIAARLDRAQETLTRLRGKAHLDSLHGTLGLDPLYRR